jgi:hypothetical protein
MKLEAEEPELEAEEPIPVRKRLTDLNTKT